MSFENAESVAQELKLYTENDGDLYRQKTTPILKNLVTKQAQGKYDHELAAQAFMYLAEAGARKYAREFDRDESRWHAIFPVEVRRQVAAEWRDEFEVEAKLGNYDHLLPKKYQKPSPPPKKAPRKKAKTTSRSPHDFDRHARQSGYRDGIEYSNHHDVIKNDVPLSLAAELFPKKYDVENQAYYLGVSKRDVVTQSEHYRRNLQIYASGFNQAIIAVIDAAEGN